MKKRLAEIVAEYYRSGGTETNSSGLTAFDVGDHELIVHTPSSRVALYSVHPGMEASGLYFNGQMTVRLETLEQIAEARRKWPPEYCLLWETWTRVEEACKEIELFRTFESSRGTSGTGPRQSINSRQP